jgi:hypothetical protein
MNRKQQIEFIARELIPTLEKHGKVIAQPEEAGVAGATASMLEAALETLVKQGIAIRSNHVWVRVGYNGKQTFPIYELA